MEHPLDTKTRITREGIRLYEPEDFAGMHKAGKLAAEILDRVIPLVEPGVTTGELDAAIEAMVNEAGATSATIGYKGYEHASCISINHVVCHGIPSDKKLKDGDILNIDVTVIVDGWFGDTSRMFVAGKMPRKAERLVDVTHEALMLASRRRSRAIPSVTSASPFRVSSRRTACRWCAISAVTGWVRCSMRRPTCCITVAPAPGRSFRKACSSPSSRW